LTRGGDKLPIINSSASEQKDDADVIPEKPNTMERRRFVKSLGLGAAALYVGCCLLYFLRYLLPTMPLSHILMHAQWKFIMTGTTGHILIILLMP
jgi:transketolase N-terminal domain/subunit